MALLNALVVDDSKTEQMVIAQLLEARGMVVRLAGNVDEARAALASAQPDVVVLDVVMPGVNGYQFTRELTRDPNFARVPVILCSSKNLPTDKVWGLRQGARAYLTKPVQAAELIAALDAIDAHE